MHHLAEHQTALLLLQVMLLLGFARGLGYLCQRVGQPAHLIFLILTTADDQGLQVQLLGALAKGISDPALRERLLAAQDEHGAWTVLRQALGQQSLVPRKR